MARAGVDYGDLMLIAATNWCSCGYCGDSLKPCSFAPATETKYRKLSDNQRGESSDDTRSSVEPARRRHRVLKPTRTIVHLAGSDAIQAPYLADGLHYRRNMI